MGFSKFLVVGAMALFTAVNGQALTLSHNGGEDTGYIKWNSDIAALTATIDLDASATGFTAGDVSISPEITDAVTSAGATGFIISTDAASVADGTTYEVFIPANAVTVGGSSNTATNVLSVVYDVTAPDIEVANCAHTNGAFKLGDSLTYTASFSEAVSFKAADITIGPTDAAVAGLGNSGSADYSTVWTFTYDTTSTETGGAITADISSVVVDFVGNLMAADVACTDATPDIVAPVLNYAASGFSTYHADGAGTVYIPAEVTYTASFTEADNAPVEINTANVCNACDDSGSEVSVTQTDDDGLVWELVLSNDNLAEGTAINLQTKGNAYADATGLTGDAEGEDPSADGESTSVEIIVDGSGATVDVSYEYAATAVGGVHNDQDISIHVVVTDPTSLPEDFAFPAAADIGNYFSGPAFTADSVSSDNDLTGGLMTAATATYVLSAVDADGTIAADFEGAAWLADHVGNAVAEINDAMTTVDVTSVSLLSYTTSFPEDSWSAVTSSSDFLVVSMYMSEALSADVGAAEDDLTGTTPTTAGGVIDGSLMVYSFSLDDVTSADVVAFDIAEFVTSISDLYGNAGELDADQDALTWMFDSVAPQLDIQEGDDQFLVAADGDADFTVSFTTEPDATDGPISFGDDTLSSDDFEFDATQISSITCGAAEDLGAAYGYSCSVAHVAGQDLTSVAISLKADAVEDAAGQTNDASVATMHYWLDNKAPEAAVSGSAAGVAFDSDEIFSDVRLMEGNDYFVVTVSFSEEVAFDVSNLQIAQSDSIPNALTVSDGTSGTDDDYSYDDFDGSVNNGDEYIASIAFSGTAVGSGVISIWVDSGDAADVPHGNTNTDASNTITINYEFGRNSVPTINTAIADAEAGTEDIADVTFTLGVAKTISYAGACDDVDGGDVDLEVSGLPSWAKFAPNAADPDAGVLSGTADAGDFVTAEDFQVFPITFSCVDRGSPPKSASTTIDLTMYLGDSYHGCTNEDASNYDADAVVDDGSCALVAATNVGSSGATLQSGGQGRYKVTFPPNAVRTTGTYTVTEKSASDVTVPNPAEGTVILGRIMDISAGAGSPTEFADEVTVCMYIDPEDIPAEKSVSMYTAESGGASWSPVISSTYDRTTGQLCGLTSHFSFFAGLTTASTAGGGVCPNRCSGHGLCSPDSNCECFRGWYGNDCSQRSCKAGVSWLGGDASSPHAWAECSNNGVCNRGTGDCECFTGYEGTACERSSCPNDCSGHGVCDVSSTFSANSGWDAGKIRHCTCDAGYGGLDCSERACPRGDDPLTVPDSSRGEEWQIVISHDVSLTVGEIGLTFVDLFGHHFRTRPVDIGSATASSAAIQAIIEELHFIGSVDSVTYTAATTSTTIDIVFSQPARMGDILVETRDCADGGCQPLRVALNTAATGVTVARTAEADAKLETATCSNRGSCDAATGNCVCFPGHTGLACELQTVLI